jgi:hypothetical protein
MKHMSGPRIFGAGTTNRDMLECSKEQGNA